MSKVPVKITYHRQRSSTARIRDGKIFLRISNMASRRVQQQHIDDLLEKMMRQFDKLNSRVKISLKSVFAEGELLLSTGVHYQVKIKKGKVKKYKVEKIGHVLVVIQPVEDLAFGSVRRSETAHGPKTEAQARREFDPEKAEEAMWKFLKKDQLPVLRDRLHELREGWMEKSFKVVKLKMVLSRWGSCDARRGIIMLSVKLLLLEPKLLDYVCVHELAHLKRQDHSDLFWDIVEKKMPDWKVQRKRLRQYE